MVGVQKLILFACLKVLQNSFHKLMENNDCNLLSSQNLTELRSLRGYDTITTQRMIKVSLSDMRLIITVPSSLYLYKIAPITWLSSLCNYKLSLNFLIEIVSQQLKTSFRKLPSATFIMFCVLLKLLSFARSSWRCLNWAEITSDECGNTVSNFANSRVQQKSRKWLTCRCLCRVYEKSRRVFVIHQKFFSNQMFLVLKTSERIFEIQQQFNKTGVFRMLKKLHTVVYLFHCWVYILVCMVNELVTL